MKRLDVVFPRKKEWMEWEFEINPKMLRISPGELFLHFQY